MCGICGFVGSDDERALHRMCDKLAHRGPDSQGGTVFSAEKLGLGHRRLRIIDLSPDADQPMTQEDGSIWIVFNGEIYNFVELRKELLDRGHRFRSQSDTEVILHLYEEGGIDCFRRLNGMFALALYDKPRAKLILARDPLGIKPLYYYRAGTDFVFASEIKAILASDKYSRALNEQAVSDYFTFLYVPCPDTIFRGIYQVPPGHTLELDLKTNGLELRRFWRITEQAWPAEASGKNGSYLEMKQGLKDLLTDSVRRQMISDVPLGVFLSGGTDSPIITGLMSQLSRKPVKTYTIVFQGKEAQFFNEQEAALAVARKFATDHHEIPVDISDPTQLMDLVEYFDQPFGNPTFYLTYLICKHSRPEVTVALCGAGGDELFAGYPRYRAVALSRWLRHLPAPVLRTAAGLSRLIPHGHRSTRLYRLGQFLGGLDRDVARQFVNWVYFFDEQEKSTLLKGLTQNGQTATRRLLPAERAFRQYLEEDTLTDFGNRMLHLDVRTFLVDNILEYTDKMSMATSLEVRVPFLDPRVVEYSLNIPFRYKLRNGQGKAILKDTFAELLPEANQQLPKKGFNAPLAQWMTTHLDSYFDRLMTKEEVTRQGLLNWDHIQLLRSQHRMGKRDNSYELFSILMFDVWYRKYLS
jgi:asparagine synthase (glutamine-hydrolysing)